MKASSSSLQTMIGFPRPGADPPTRAGQPRRRALKAVFGLAASVAWVLLALGESLGSQNPYGAEATAFRVQVIPNDRDGRFVKGLVADDFAILVGGVAAKVLAVDEVAGRVEDSAAAPRVVIALDLYTGARREREWDTARSEIGEFVRLVDGSHEMAIVATRVRGPVELYSDFSTDPKQVLSGLARAFAAMSQRAPSAAARRSTESRGPNGGAVSLGAITRYLSTGRYLFPRWSGPPPRAAITKPSKGRRSTHLLFFSMGDREVSLENPRFRESLDVTLETLRRHAVTVHAFQPFGMPSARDDRAPLQYMALETAGSLWMYEQSVAAGLATVRSQIDQYYVVTFVVPEFETSLVELSVEFPTSDVVSWSGPRMLDLER